MPKVIDPLLVIRREIQSIGKIIESVSQRLSFDDSLAVIIQESPSTECK